MKDEQLPNTEADESKPVWLTTPDEFVAAEAGRWVVVPGDRADARLAQGVRKQVTKAMAMNWHRTHIETALELGFPIAVASMQFHGLALPKGYVQKRDFFVKRRPSRRQPGSTNDFRR